MLSWTDESDDESGFKIERKSSGGTYSQIAAVGANVISCLNGGLSPNTAYSYRVRAYRTTDYSAFSNEAVTTTLPLPTAPEGLKATAVSAARIDLTWKDMSGDESGFRIERKSGSGSFAQVQAVGANITAYSNSGLTANTTFTYRIRALRGVDYSAYSTEASATTLPLPVAPSALTAKAISRSRIDLVWADNSTDETGFRVERKTNGGGFTVVATVGAGVTSYSNSGLTANTVYTYRVRACRNTDYSHYAGEAAATTLPL